MTPQLARLRAQLVQLQALSDAARVGPPRPRPVGPAPHIPRLSVLDILRVKGFGPHGQARPGD